MIACWKDWLCFCHQTPPLHSPPKKTKLNKPTACNSN